MVLHRTSISSRSSCATLLLTAAVLTKLPGQPARRLKPQPINKPPRRAHKLMPSTVFSASRPISLQSPLWMIKGTQSRIPAPFLPLPLPILLLPALRLPTLASARHQRSNFRQVLMEGRRPPSRRLTRVREASHVCQYRLLTLMFQSRITMDLQTTSGSLPNLCVTL